MKVSFDGLRRNLACAYSRLAKEINRDGDRDDVLECLGELRQFVAFMLLCSEPDAEERGDFHDLSDLADTLPWPDGQEPEDNEEEG